MSGQRCPKCGGYVWADGICQSCGYSPKARPHFEFGKVDVFKLAEGLKAKEQANIKRQSEKAVQPTQNATPDKVKISKTLKDAGKLIAGANQHYEAIVNDEGVVMITTVTDDTSKEVARVVFSRTEWKRLIAWVE
jgi:uncharacterized FlaG/YvyC family protein